MARRFSALITGGAGFIGTHLARRLLRAGVQVRSLDIASPRNPVDEVEYVKGDVRDERAVREAVKGTEAVFHLAAIASVPLCQKDPVESYRTNLMSTPTLLEAMCAERESSGRATRILFTSTSALYGNSIDKTAPAVPAKEEPLAGDPISFYAMQKMNSEQAIRLYRATRGIPAVVFRLFNVFGPGQDPKSQYSGVISIFAEAVRAGRKLQLNGGGVQTRDFVSVHDVVRAFELGMNLPEAACDGKAINLASGRTVSIRELAQIVMQAAGHSVPVEDAPWREGDIMHSCADITRARTILNWKPEVSLEEGLAELMRPSG